MSTSLHEGGGDKGVMHYLHEVPLLSLICNVHQTFLLQQTYMITSYASSVKQSKYILWWKDTRSRDIFMSKSAITLIAE